jgi:hypothetical protein
MIIEELLIALGYKLDAAPLEEASQKAHEAAEGMESRWKTAGLAIGGALAAVGTAAVGAAAGLFKLADEGTKVGDEIAKGARAAGTNSIEYQRMAFAADRAGVSKQQLSVGLRSLTVQLDRARSGGAEPFRNALERIGLTVHDLGESAEENMGILSDALNKVSSDQERLALQSEIFGTRAGPQFASLIAEGSAGIRSLGDEAERLGKVMTEDALASSESFQDSLTNMRAALGSVTRDIGIELAPAVQSVTDDITNWIAENGELIRQDVGEIGKSLADGISAALPMIQGAISGIRVLTQTTQGFFQLVDEMTGAAATRRETARTEERIREEQMRMQRGFQNMSTEHLMALREGIDPVAMARGRGAAGMVDAGRQAVYQQQRREVIDRELAARSEPVIEHTRWMAETARQQAESFETQERDRIRRRQRSRSGRAGRDPTDATVIDEHEFEALELFGDDIESMARQIGANDMQISEAIKAAGQALSSHASPSVALQAARRKLQSLTGETARTHDPVLSEIFGEDMPFGMPSIRLSEMTGRHEPNVLVNTNNVTNTVEVQISVDGSSDPISTGNGVLEVLRTELVEVFEQAGRTSGPTMGS